MQCIIGDIDNACRQLRTNPGFAAPARHLNGIRTQEGAWLALDMASFRKARADDARCFYPYDSYDHTNPDGAARAMTAVTICKQRNEEGHGIQGAIYDKV